MHAGLQWHLVHACEYVGLVLCELGFEESVYEIACVFLCVGGCMRNVFDCYLLCHFCFTAASLQTMSSCYHFNEIFFRSPSDWKVFNNIQR